jgi:hypothetical protein
MWAEICVFVEVLSAGMVDAFDLVSQLLMARLQVGRDPLQCDPSVHWGHCSAFSRETVA